MMPLHYVRHKHCAIRPCSDGLRTGAASERPAPTRCASAFVCLSLLKKPNEREREREREREGDCTDTRADKRTNLTAPERLSRRSPAPVLAGPCAAYLQRSEEIRCIRRGAAVSASLL